MEQAVYKIESARERESENKACNPFYRSQLGLASLVLNSQTFLEKIIQSQSEIVLSKEEVKLSNTPLEWVYYIQQVLFTGQLYKIISSSIYQSGNPSELSYIS